MPVWGPVRRRCLLLVGLAALQPAARLRAPTATPAVHLTGPKWPLGAAPAQPPASCLLIPCHPQVWPPGLAAGQRQAAARGCRQHRGGAEQEPAAPGHRLCRPAAGGCRDRPSAGQPCRTTRASPWNAPPVWCCCGSGAALVGAGPSAGPNAQRCSSCSPSPPSQIHWPDRYVPLFGEYLNAAAGRGSGRPLPLQAW